MRIIAGACRNRRIQGLPGLATRPTPDRVREALFNILAPRTPDTHFLDLYAGSGANGIEALSRGAASATFVEQSAEAARIIRTNLQHLGLTPRATVRHQALPGALADLPAPSGGYGLVFADPPYGRDDYRDLLEALSASVVLAQDAWVVIEHSVRTPPPGAVGRFAPGQTRRYGDTALSFFVLDPP